jgi:hypothetical protein
MEKLSVLPVLSTGAMVAIGFFVIAGLVMAWAICTARPMTKEEEELDRFFDEMYKSKRPLTPKGGMDYEHSKRNTNAFGSCSCLAVYIFSVY